MLNRLVSAIFLVFIALTSSLLFVIALLLRVISYPFDRRLRLLHLFTCFWGSIYTWVMPAWRIRIEGRENVRKNKAYMIVSNHQSQMDILVAFRLFFHYKWVSKSEMFRVPFVGWNMSLNRYVKLKRGDKESVEKMLRECAIHLREGSSIFMFPEGTRSPDGEVKNFKLGAFEMALKEKVPILPIVVSGTNKALPKYSMNFHGVQKMYIKIFEEIPYSAFKNLSATETAEMVRQFIIKKLKIMNEYSMAN
ncbi:MAG TPA: lysophospholipid acyltransferase family protein [Smithella sp.]|nr:lysophospholipid acyltransferase family protein [Smithella sp.]